MDSRIYFHQYRRPRYNNPTYVSSNVNTSLTFFDEKPSYQYPPNTYGNNNFSTVNYDSYLQKGDVNTINANNNYNNRNPPGDRHNTLQYNNNSNNQTALENPKEYNQPSYIGNRSNSQGRNHSNLSTYGSNSLTLNQNDIFNKQNSKFNIINMRPKEFNTQIRQYPKYTLQNKDQLYYKRMAEQFQKKQIPQFNNQANQNNPSNRTNVNISYNSMPPNNFNTQIIAGKNTYNSNFVHQAQHNLPQNNSSRNYNNNQYSHQLPLNDQNATINTKKQFTAKMLNHMDQLSSLS